MNTYNVVVGASRKQLIVPIVDAQGAPIALSGATARLKGWSLDLPGYSIDLVGVVTDGPGGLVTFSSIGNLVTTDILGAKWEATFTCTVEWQDVDGKDYTEDLALRFIRLHDTETVLSAGLLPEGGHPFDFPFPTGTSRMVMARPVVNPGFTSGARVVLFSSPPGTSGIVRDFSWVTQSLAQAGFPSVNGDLTFEIKYDGEASASVSIPLATLVAMEYPRSSRPLMTASTPAFELSASPYTTEGGAPGGWAGHFRLPIPFTDGIEISVVAPGNTNRHAIYSNIVYQEGLPPCWNARLRLFADRTVGTAPASVSLGTARLADATHLEMVSGTLPADIEGCAISATFCINDIHVLSRTDATHAVVSSRDTALATLMSTGGVTQLYQRTFLNRPAGEAGWLAMVVAACANAGEAEIIMEGNVRLLLDQHAEAELTWTSVEDFVNGAFYFTQQNRVEDGGVMSLNLDNGEWSFYKVLSRFPVRYADGVRGLVPNYSEGLATEYRWTTFHYRVMP